MNNKKPVLKRVLIILLTGFVFGGATHLLLNYRHNKIPSDNTAPTWTVTATDLDSGLLIPPTIDDENWVVYANAPVWGIYPADQTGKKPEKQKKIAEGACIDKALSVLSILERNNKLDNSIFVALGGHRSVGYHVQCVKIDKDDAKHYLKLDDSFNVVYSKSDFDDFGSGEEYLYIEPEVFRQASMQYKPNMNYMQFRDFYRKYKQEKQQLAKIDKQKGQ